MAAIVLIYYGIAAVASPISDKRMITALQAVSIYESYAVKNALYGDFSIPDYNCSNMRIYESCAVRKAIREDYYDRNS